MKEITDGIYYDNDSGKYFAEIVKGIFVEKKKNQDYIRQEFSRDETLKFSLFKALFLRMKQLKHSTGNDVMLSVEGNKYALQYSRNKKMTGTLYDFISELDKKFGS